MAWKHQGRNVEPLRLMSNNDIHHVCVVGGGAPHQLVLRNEHPEGFPEVCLNVTLGCSLSP